jgi:hypothetical protein
MRQTMTPSNIDPDAPGRSGQAAGVDDPGEALAVRIEALWRRVVDIERSLAVQEWWMLGRALPEARLLAEISSLLAVVRAELEAVLAQTFGRALPMSGQMDAQASGSDTTGPHNEAWAAASRDQAIGLLRMVALALPSMRQFTQALADYCHRARVATAITDALEVVSGRLVDVDEALRQPPR